MADTNTNGSAMNNEMQDLYTGRVNHNGRTDTQILESIERQIEQLVKNGGSVNNMSASNANNRYGKNGSTFYQNLNGKNFGRGTYKDFEQALKKSMIDELFGTEFKKSMGELRKQLAKDLGVELGDIPKSLGQLTGKLLADKLKNSSIGKAILEPLNKYKSDLAKQITEAYNRGAQPFRNSPAQGRMGDMPDLSNMTDEALSEALKSGSQSATSEITKGVNEVLRSGEGGGLVNTISGMTQNALNNQTALGGLTEVAKTVGPQLTKVGLATGGALIAVSLVTDYLIDAVKPSLEAFKKLMDDAVKASKRNEKSREENLKLSRERMAADVKTMVETPFKILQDAAEKWYQTWDSTLRNISATQGYTKEQVYQLYSAYADRLRSEGLTDVIGSTDIINNLSNVLASGLQGAAAEEFAYIATKLNAAIPTQDFFNYTEGYITAVSNAMNQGKTQAEALAIANEELEVFANSLLYAGREISGGFTTGLKGAEALFQKAEQIAQAGKYGDGTQLGASLTAISAITGAIAPDLASSIVESIYKAAVGGNSSDIVALRSLAGINASNTEFLQALMTNPQDVFGAMFDKLNMMQNMSNGAYMEVAEGLSSVFGISMESLSRIDFSQVASAVRASANPNSALNQNMKLLQSGQTTTNAEILRMREINQYIAEEGLQYVLDNEAGRQIQQHLWDEAIAKEVMEATYGVELKGSALNVLNAISDTLNKLKNFMSVGALANKLSELKTTSEQEDAMRDDIRKMLELGKVGSGNAAELALLTAATNSSNIVENYVEMLGGQSSYKATQAEISRIRKRFGGAGYNQNQMLDEFVMAINPFAGHARSAVVDSGLASLRERLQTTGGITSSGITSPSINSAYEWGRVGKSTLSMLGAYGMTNYDNGISAVALSTAVSASQTQTRLTNNLQKMLDSMDEYYNADNTRTYEDYVKTAKQYGIADFTKALEEGGLTEEAVRSRYGDLQNQTAIAKQAERYKTEETFWEESVAELMSSNTWLDSINSTATNIYNLFDNFVSAWKDYFIEHTVYNSAYNRETVEKVLSAERSSSETAIYALADALTQNDVGLLVDPTMQTNALLAQILKVANAILVQNGTGTAISLPDTLAGLSLGIINTE